jgi:hypothetical protein
VPIKSSILVSVLYLMGLYAPSSITGVYSEALWALYLVIVGVLFMGIALCRDGLASEWTCINSLLIIAALIGSTILSPFPDYRWGGLLPYLVLALLFTLDIRKIDTGGSFRTVFVVTNVVNIVWGAAMVLGNERVDNFVVSHYSAFYPGLVELMTELRKPVLSFGTHSIAGFFMYLLFWLNLETAKATKKRAFVLFAACFLSLTVALLSFTGFGLGALALFQLFQYMSARRPKLVTALLVVICLSCTLVVRHYDLSMEDWAAATKAATDVLSSPTSGFQGRFSQVGTLYSTVNYLKDRPFGPVGVGYRSDLFFGDCGPIEYYLRGSIFLLAGIYGGLFAFLRRNMLSKADATLLFVVIFVFELGLTSLPQVRTLYLLPVVVVYLNHLRRHSIHDGMALA